MLFAIEAGVRLGRKLNEALVSSTLERPLLLPIGELYGEIGEIEAIEFFDREENQALTAPGGPYAGHAPDELIKAFKTLQRVDDALGGNDLSVARETIAQLHAFEQIKTGHGALPALQQVLGELVNLGVDNFAANPGSLVPESSARRVLSAALLGSAEAVGGDMDVLFPAGAAARPLIDAALRQVLRGIESDAELFSSAAVRQLIGSVLEAVAADTELFGLQALAQRVIEHASAALAAETSLRVFDRGLTPTLVDAALRIAVRHADALTADGNDAAATMRQASTARVSLSRWSGASCHWPRPTSVHWSAGAISSKTRSNERRRRR